MLSVQNLFLIGGFGLLGIFSRFSIDVLTASWVPVGTWIINILGCALAGLVFTLGEKDILSQSLQMGLLVGFCGGFTTFSAYALQSFQLLEKGQLWMSLVYFSLSPVSGFLAAAFSVFLSRKFLA